MVVQPLVGGHACALALLAGRGKSVAGLVTASWGQMEDGLTRAMP